MRIRALLALLPAAALAVPASPADAALHGKVAAVYVRVPNGAGQEIVTFACAGAGLGAPQSFSCTVSPYLAAVVAPSNRGGSVIAGPVYDVRVSLSVRSTDGRTYTCTRSVTLTVGVGAPAGELNCTA